jgi:probable HAF family extracellular repeat protein
MASATSAVRPDWRCPNKKESLMKLTMNFSLRCALLAALLPAGLGASAYAQSYTVADLGTLGGQYGSGSGLNNIGQVVGTYYSPSQGGYLSVLTGAAGAAPLKAFGLYSQGRAVNSSGQVAGQFVNASLHSHAFLSGVQGTGPLKDLGSLGGDFSYSISVNTRGQVVGTSLLSYGNVDHAFLSGPNGGPLKDLGTLGGPYSYGVGVNDSGQVSGTSDIAAKTPQGYSISHAYLSGPNGGPLTDLGTLGGGYSEGTRLNMRGQVTGSAATATGAVHAFLSGPNGMLPLQDLGALDGVASTGDDVNAAGLVVGASSYVGSTGQYDTHAFLYTNGAMTDLNSFVDPASGITLTEATGITDSGYILASGTTNGQTGTYLLTPASLGPVNAGPNLVVTASASPADVNNFRQISITVTNTGAKDADLVEITSITLNGAAPPSGDIHNTLPTIKNLLPPGASETKIVVYQILPGSSRASLSVGGDYIDPTTNSLGHFGSASRLALP